MDELLPWLKFYVCVLYPLLLPLLWKIKSDKCDDSFQ